MARVWVASRCAGVVVVRFGVVWRGWVYCSGGVGVCCAAAMQAGQAMMKARSR